MQRSKSLALTVLLFLALIGPLGSVLTRAASETNNPPAWSAPTAKALKKVSPIWPSQHEPNFLNNTDCQLMSYRLVNDDATQTSCFTDTAYGMFSPESNLGIFNGSDEAVPLIPFSAHQVLVPWPGALNVLTLDSAPTGGSYLSMYTNPLTALEDQRNLLGKLTAKYFKAPPDLTITDSGGERVLINPQTLAFSDGGSWLVFESMSGAFVRMNLASMSMLPFAPAYGTVGSPGLLKSNVSITGSGKYAAVQNNVADTFKVYDLTSCPLAAQNLHSDNCPAYDYLPFVKQNIPGLRSIRHLRFVNDGLLSFEATSTSSEMDGVYELAPTDSITSLIDYLGMGDSFSSGEGAFDYLAGTDSDVNHCHLSSQSYPLLLTHDLFSSTGGHSVACSGAVINDIGATSAKYRGQVSHISDFGSLQANEPALLNSIQTNFLPGYIAQQRFVRQYQPSFQTVMIGGNDIGFGDMLEKCVMFKLSLHTSDNTCYNTYEDRLEILNLVDRTIPRWAALYRELVSAAPGTHLYAIGYPEIAIDNGNCALNVHLGKNELEFAVELTHYLNDAIAEAASAAGVSYIDIGDALAGHRLCETASYNVAVNGLTAGNDAGLLGINFLGKESYHPNALGQHLIEEAIIKQTNHFTTYVAPKQTANKSALLNKPKTGRKLAAITPVSAMTNKRAKKGSNIQISHAGAASGLKPRTTYKVTLDGPEGVTIGSVTTDPNGNFNGSVVIPPDTSTGGHSIDITGENQAGEAADVTQPIYVEPDGNDLDNDGAANLSDSCPTIPNSGIDSDQDGVDDACDGSIGTSSSGNGANSEPTIGGAQGNGESGGTAGMPASVISPVQVTIAGVFSALSAPNNTTAAKYIKQVLGAKTTNPQVDSPRLHLQPTATINPRQGSKLPSPHWQQFLRLGVIWWAALALLIFLTIFIGDLWRRERAHKFA
jgi:hypothetical protein